MTTYTFKPSDSSQSVNWNDPSVWVGGVVPNSSDADVVFPHVTYLATGATYYSDITIGNGQQFVANSVDLEKGETLEIDGSLSVGASVTVNGGLDISGTLTVSSLINNSYTAGGEIEAGQVINNGKLGATVSATSFTNNGEIEGTASIITNTGGFTNLSNGILTGGSYETSGYTGNINTISINSGSIISTDAANINLDGGVMQSYDSSTSQYVPIQSSLHTIASSGSLSISNGSYAFGPLEVAGSLVLGDEGSFTGLPDTFFSAQSLQIEQGGQLTGNSTVQNPIDNNGLIEAGPPLLGIGQQQALKLLGPVTGSGRLEINGAGGAELELGGATSQTVTFDGSGELVLDAPSTFTGEIAPAQHAGDQIVLENIAQSSIIDASYAGNASGGTLTLQEATGTISLNFLGDFDLSSFTITAGPQLLSSDPPSTLISLVCFAEGSHIRTVRGDVAVEKLAVGDIVVTASGAHRPIRWLGHRTIDCRRHPCLSEALPIRVAAHAFGVDKPHRDLWLSPGHSICVDVAGEVLIPVSALVNGTTIEQVEVETVTYWHVELDSHDIILAEGLPTESYLDMENRGFFASEGIVELAGVPDAIRRTHADFCRPYYEAGPPVDAVRARLALQAGALAGKEATGVSRFYPFPRHSPHNPSTSSTLRSMA